MGVYLALKVLLVLRVDKGHLDHQANLVKRVKLVFPAFQGQLEEMDCLAFEAYLEFLDPRRSWGRWRKGRNGTTWIKGLQRGQRRHWTPWRSWTKRTAWLNGKERS